MLKFFSNPSRICNRGCVISSSLSTARKQKLKERSARFSARNVLQTDDALPKFNDLLRKLYRISHPDLLRSSYPNEADVNDSSLQVLNGIISSIKVYNEFPAQILKTIPFYLRIAGNNDLVKVELKIATPGGDCRKNLSATFETFFSTAQIHEGRFSWGKEFFPAVDSSDSSDTDN